MKELWMIDLEGTLTDNNWRKHLITGPEKDWREYYKGLLQDPAVESIKDLVCVLPQMTPPREVIIYTTRMPNKYNMEISWLSKQNLNYHDLMMRENTKLTGPQLLREWCKKLQPTYVVDDRADNRNAVMDIVPNVLGPDDLTTINLEKV